MNAEEYIRDRVDEQQRWFDGKSAKAQRSYKTIRYAQIGLGAAIPVIAGFVTGSIPGTEIDIDGLLVSVIGAIIAILAATEGIGQFNANWIRYRTSAEALKREKFLFLTSTEPYADSDAFQVLVQRVESLLANENAGWTQEMKEAAKDAHLKSTPNKS